MCLCLSRGLRVKLPAVKTLYYLLIVLKYIVQVSILYYFLATFTLTSYSLKYQIRLDTLILMHFRGIIDYLRHLTNTKCLFLKFFY